MEDKQELLHSESAHHFLAFLLGLKLKVKNTCLAEMTLYCAVNLISVGEAWQLVKGIDNRKGLKIIHYTHK